MHPRCYYRHEEGPPETWPALLARITDLDGRQTGTHRTWLAGDGSGKAPLDPLRKAMGDLLAEMMDASCEDVLAYMAFPDDHWPQIVSTNSPERVDREIKRRSDVVGIFPDDAAVRRLVGALTSEINDEWTVSRRTNSL